MPLPAFFIIRIFPDSGWQNSLKIVIFPANPAGGGERKGLISFFGFFVVVDQLAPVHAFPVLRKVFPVRSGFHDRIMLCAAHKTFHRSSIRPPVSSLFLSLSCNHCRSLRVINSWNGEWALSFSKPKMQSLRQRIVESA